MLGIRYSEWNSLCEVSTSGRFSLHYSSFRENDAIILTHKFSRKSILPLESSSTPLGVWEKDGHVAGKQLLYQESLVSVLIRRILQNEEQAFKNSEATLGPDTARKYVITSFLLPAPEHQPPAFLFLLPFQHYSCQLILDIGEGEKLCLTTCLTSSMNCPVHARGICPRVQGVGHLCRNGTYHVQKWSNFIWALLFSSLKL